MENIKNKLELSFIEEGRLSDDQMNNINGGGTECGTYVNCGQTGLNTCTRYSVCNIWGKDTCGQYTCII